MLKNNTYPLSESAVRTIQVKVIAHYALEVGAEAIYHGSTELVMMRFDVVFNILAPQMEIITPICNLKLSREGDFLKEHGVDMNFEKAKYSINKGFYGSSVGGKESLTSHEYLPEDVYLFQVEKTEQKQHTLPFDHDELVGIDGEIYNHPTKAFKKLEKLAAPFGIGRDIHVGDAIIGIKARVGFEAV